MSESNNVRQRIAAKALIVNSDGKVLILREADTYADGNNIGRYHLPGGRIERGEPFYDGLKREIMEETGLTVEIQKPLLVGEWWPTIKGEKNQIVAVFMMCRANSNKVVLSDEHDMFEWIEPVDHAKFDIMAPDPDVIKVFMASL